MSIRQDEYHRYRSPESNPCIKESDMSLQCLENQNYDRSRCEVFFENYKRCQAFWRMISNRRMREGIRPVMPGERERELIKAERDKGNDVIYVVED